MMNRPAFFPIISAVALSLSVAHGQTAAPLPASTGTSPAVAPAPTAPDTSDTSPSSGERPTTYTVVSGDSLWLIAHKFNTSIHKLKKLNKLTKNNLKPGQVLQIPPAPGTETPAPSTPAASPPATSTTQPKPTSHHKAKTTTQSESPVADALPPNLSTELSAYEATQTLSSASTPATVATTTPSHHHKKKAASTPDGASPEISVANAQRAQPVQDFDIPASTFASCPVPQPVETAAERAAENNPSTPAAPTPVAPAPRAEPAGPSELASAPAPEKPTSVVTEPPAAAPTPETSPAPSSCALSQSSKHSSQSFVTDSTTPDSQGAPESAGSGDWATRFKLEAEILANRGIEYDEDWCPPGESHSWAMDCSNTSRYLYKITTGIQLPRTASDQYYYLHLQDKAWDVPDGSNGYADMNYLRENLKPGDLLFWENTYRPERQPPITHVMIFLGTNEKGQWIMAGSQTSRGGLHNRRNGGPDIYVFDPDKPCGGYSTWLGLVHHQGRFCAYGRPLEADPSKLNVANN
jgi:LysM repeat protein